MSYQTPPQPLSTGGQKPLPERNPLTARKHRREVFRQITIPLVIGIVIVVVFAAVSVIGPNNQVSRIADISLIWLIAPAMLFGLIFLVLNVLMVYGLYKLLQVLPGYARLTQDFFALAGRRVRQYSDTAVEPFVRASSVRARWEAFWAAVRGTGSEPR